MSLDPFAHLADGPMLVAQQRAVEAALRTVQRAPEDALHLAADATCATLMPAFGMQIMPMTVPDPGDRARQRSIEVRVWSTTTPFAYFWSRLAEQVTAHITTTATADGQVLQRVTAADLVDRWQLYHAYYWTATTARTSPGAPPPPTEAHMPIQIAALLADLGGVPWHVTDDGSAAERVLPNQPLRMLPTAGTTPRPGYLKNKLSFPCVGWAYLPANSALNDEAEHTLVYLSGVGIQKKLKAVWATLADSKRDPIELPLGSSAAIRARRPAGKGVYDTYWNDDPLPESGMAHLVIQHRSMLHPRPGQPFLHLTGADGLPDLDLFARQLDAASTLPIQPAWVAALWDAAYAAKLIRTLPSYGCTAYWVRVSDELAWSTLLAQCAGASAASIETYGAEASETPHVAEVATDA